MLLIVIVTKDLEQRGMGGESGAGSEGSEGWENRVCELLLIKKVCKSHPELNEKLCIHL